eukprot:scaffold93405_cov28-Prasinocladus_malaysianus.AAC.6
MAPQHASRLSGKDNISVPGVYGTRRNTNKRKKGLAYANNNLYESINEFTRPLVQEQGDRVTRLDHDLLASEMRAFAAAPANANQTASKNNEAPPAGGVALAYVMDRASNVNPIQPGPGSLESRLAQNPQLQRNENVPEAVYQRFVTHLQEMLQQGNEAERVYRELPQAVKEIVQNALQAGAQQAVRVGQDAMQAAVPAASEAIGEAGGLAEAIAEQLAEFLADRVVAAGGAANRAWQFVQNPYDVQNTVRLAFDALFYGPAATLASWLGLEYFGLVNQGAANIAPVANNYQVALDRAGAKGVRATARMAREMRRLGHAPADLMRMAQRGPAWRHRGDRA